MNLGLAFRKTEAEAGGFHPVAEPTDSAAFRGNPFRNDRYVPLTGVKAADTKKASSNASKEPKVAILLCTHQGQRFLQEQLESFADQTHKNWELWASDDASDDLTLELLAQFQKKIGADRISIHSGPNNGFCVNFLSLACKAEIAADYYAYSDQDDIWKPEKLARALAYLQTVPAYVPALYCSRTELVDAIGNHLGYSPLFKKTPSFKNALVQSIGGGNTMVFNHAARLLFMKAGADVQVVRSE